jgi:hypothetical protein
MEHIKIFIINQNPNTTSEQKVQQKYAIMQQLWENDCIADILDKETPNMFQLIVDDGYMAGLILYDHNLYYDTVEHFLPDLPRDWDICYFASSKNSDKKRSFLISNYAALKVVQNNGQIDDLLPSFTKYVIDADKILLDV